MDADFLLIQRIRNGDDHAIDIFVHKYYTPILKYCRLHINDYGFAEDLTQDTFVSFFRTVGQYQHYGKALNYLYVIAGNKCRDFYRKQHELTLDQLPEPSESSLDKLDDWMDVHIALKKLPPDIRETAILYYMQGLKQSEIAPILNIGLPLVKYKIRKAKQLLRSYLEEGRL